jgi:indole-3-glycerol phosphate synthase
MHSILEDILSAKRKAVSDSKKKLPFDLIKEKITALPAARDFRAAVSSGPGTRIIAEIKKASPSSGIILRDFDPVKIAGDYYAGGAAALSVLTEENYFMGDPAYINDIKNSVPLPILRKDFIFDIYEVYESKYIGADAVLLIASILETRKLAELFDAASGLGLSVLVEIHDEDDLRKAVSAGAKLIGINNRNLSDFKIDFNTSYRLIPKIAGGTTIVVESGIKTREEIENFENMGVRAFLVGETVMKCPDRAACVKELRGIS